MVLIAGKRNRFQCATSECTPFSSSKERSKLAMASANWHRLAIQKEKKRKFFETVATWS